MLSVFCEELLVAATHPADVGFIVRGTAHPVLVGISLIFRAAARVYSALGTVALAASVAGLIGAALLIIVEGLSITARWLLVMV